MRNTRFYVILSVISVLLLIPLVAMQFTEEVIWSGSDFMVMGILLLITGLTSEVVLRKMKKTSYRIIIIGIIFIIFFLIWAELSVGIL